MQTPATRTRRARGSNTPMVAGSQPAAPTPATQAAPPTLMQAAVQAALAASANPAPTPVQAAVAAMGPGGATVAAALASLPAATQAAVLAAIAQGQAAPAPAVGRAVANLPPPNTVLVTLTPKRALTGKRFGGTLQCYNTAVALAAAGNLTVATISAACAQMGNPQWPQYAYGKWLAQAPPVGQ